MTDEPKTDVQIGTELLNVGYKLLGGDGTRRRLEIDLLWDSVREAAPKNSLLKRSFQVFSQADEDGIIEEIFRRLPTLTQPRFVELGCGDGLESNGLYLLHKGWEGLWVDANEDYIQKITQWKARFPKLCLSQAFLTVTDDDLPRVGTAASQVVKKFIGDGPFDLLSIDVDGNDYWIWKSIIEAMPHKKPLVCVVEYNAKFGPTCEWVMPYKPDHVWDGSHWQGASLKSLELLGRELGYFLVGCNITGVNAFFVQDVLTEQEDDGGLVFPFDIENDDDEFTSERLYQPPRYYFQHTGHQTKIPPA